MAGKWHPCLTLKSENVMPLVAGFENGSAVESPVSISSKWEMGNEEMGNWNGNAQVLSRCKLEKTAECIVVQSS